jgi:glycine/D-amino acid oxidase-like deaminating enzyme
MEAGVDLPVVLRNNQMMVTEPAPPLLEHVVFHVDGHLTLKQVYPARSCLVGGGWPGGGDFRAHRNETRLASTLGNAAVAVRIVPALAGLRVLRSWSGFDWRTFDQMPVIGEVPGWEGMFVCTSCFGGYTLSPLLGRALAQGAATGSVPAVWEPFSPDRTLARYEAERVGVQADGRGGLAGRSGLPSPPNPLSQRTGRGGTKA